MNQEISSHNPYACRQYFQRGRVLPKDFQEPINALGLAAKIPHGEIYANLRLNIALGILKFTPLAHLTPVFSF